MRENVIQILLCDIKGNLLYDSAIRQSIHGCVAVKLPFLTLILTFSIKVKNIGSHIDLGKTLKFTA